MVSLIITTYNYAQFIERAIRSGLDQSLSKTDFEVIVINDASTDATEAILENYSDVVRVFKARGQFVAFLDADDYLHSESLRVQNLFLNENNAFDAVAIDYYVVNERGQHIEHISSSDKPIACGIMFRKDYLFNIGLYDENFTAREEEDLRIGWEQAGYGIYHIPVPLYRYRMLENNLTKDNQKMTDSQLKLNQKHNR